jgi:hypothetical protein
MSKFLNIKQRIIVSLLVFIFFINLISALEQTTKGEVDYTKQELMVSITRAEHNCIPIPETKALVASSETFYMQGDYDSALNSLNEAHFTYALETKGEFNFGCYIRNKILDNWTYIFGLVIILVAGTYGIARYSKKK